ncbi:Wzz/FepE/Etk N-terminal domain-containing protein [Smaragdicoccus niigatensis]|uniref:Wzz/FepE/Etk N-terminal domain-containing protein n=1 Tax=Smaragdicoccus niigatensis TaxID=359359 RepID=UPI00035F6A62|nr:Wzz/FepE/Etk N-terminal domain-containing protein [Smaragdicoccus niigatensis]
MSLAVTDYARLLRDRWRMVALVTLVGIIAGIAVAMIRDRPVSASVDIQVPLYSAGGSPSAVELAEERQRVRKYVELARSEQVATPVARQFGMSAEDVRSAVAALSAPDAAMFRLTASDPDPVRAVAIAQAVSFKVVAAGRADHLWATFVKLDERPPARVVVLGSAGVAGGIAGLIASVFVVAWSDQRRK